MLSNYVVNYLAGFGSDQGTTGFLLGKRKQSFPQCLATASRPSIFIERERVAKCFAAFAREESPRDR
jgi:hypothetical protein